MSPDSTPFSSLRARAAFAGLVLVLLAPGPVWAQNEPTEPPPAEAVAPPPPPETVALANIAERAESLDRTLREIEADEGVGVKLALIEEALPAMRSLLAEMEDDLSDQLRGSPARSRLADSGTDWTQRQVRLEQWREQIRQRVAEIEEEIADLETRRGVWERTREEAKAVEVPAATLERIRGALAGIDRAAEHLSGQRDAVLTLQDGVVRESQVVSEVLDTIRLAEQDFQKQLLQRDAPPLWADLVMQGPEAGLETVVDSLETDLRILRRFATNHAPYLLVDALVFLLTLYGTFALRRRVKAWGSDGPDLGTSVLMFQRPVSMALLLLYMISSLYHPRPPSTVLDLLGLAMIAPILRLLPPLFDASVRPILFGVAGFYVVSRLRALFDAAPVTEEMFFALEVVGAIAMLAWLLRPRRLAKFRSAMQVPRVLRVGVRLALILLIGALVLNLLGFRSFSKILGDGVFESIYLAVVAYAFVRLVDVVLRASFHTERARAIGVIRRRGPTVLRWANRLTLAIVGLVWVHEVLGLFTILERVLEALGAVVNATLSLGEVELSLGDALAFVLTVVAAFTFSKLLRFVLDEDVFPRLSLRRGVPNAVSTLLHYVILLFGFGLAVAAAGVDFGRVTLLAGAFGVGIGFGLQSIVNNFISGLILLFERPIQVGDTIEVGGLMGDVRRIGIRSSTVRTFDGAEVIVPNASLISDQVINWTLSDRRRRVDVDVGVAYGTDPNRVMEILVEVAGANETVLSDPPPTALFMGFGDSSLDFRLRVWIPRFEEGYSMRSELSVSIEGALREANVTIPFPQRDLHLRTVEPEAGARIARRPGDDES